MPMLAAGSALPALMMGNAMGNQARKGLPGPQNISTGPGFSNDLMQQFLGKKKGNSSTSSPDDTFNAMGGEPY